VPQLGCTARVAEHGCGRLVEGILTGVINDRLTCRILTHTGHKPEAAGMFGGQVEVNALSATSTLQLSTVDAVKRLGGERLVDL